MIRCYQIPQRKISSMLTHLDALQVQTKHVRSTTHWNKGLTPTLIPVLARGTPELHSCVPLHTMPSPNGVSGTPTLLPLHACGTPKLLSSVPSHTMPSSMEPVVLPLSFHYTHVVLPSSIALCLCTPCRPQMESVVLPLSSTTRMWYSRAP